MNIKRMEVVSADQLVPASHTYIKLNKSLDFNCITMPVKFWASKVGAYGLGKERLVTCHIL